MNEIKLTIRPFEMGTEKEAAKKVQEEAGEAFAEYVILQEQQYRGTTRLADEIADVIQAACNLAVRYDINLQAAMERCERRNRGRGRYEDTKSCGACGGNDCNCGGGGGDVPGGDDAPKSPEKMSAAELIEALYLASGYRGIGKGYYEDGSCTKTLGVDWCDTYHTCRNCRKRLLNLLETAYKQEKEGLRCEESYLADEIVKRDKEIDGLKKEIADLAHERDGLRNRLAELDEAGITSLHRLLRETLGEAKNVTDNARVYIDRQQGGKDERCGDCGSIGRNHGGDCGAERAGEHLLPAEQTAQEMSEREKVVEQLRGIEFDGDKVTLSDICLAVMGRDPSLGAWWNETTRRELRDKLIELLSTPGWDYCKTCELVKSDDGE